MRKTVFLKNAVILTASSLVLRFAGIIFKVYITQLIGSEGVGLYQLVFSFYMLASTFATSGISTAVTRLITEEIALGTKKSTLKIFKRSIELTLIVALISVAVVYFGAEFIAKTIIGDIRSLPAIKILPLSLPFMGVSSCIRGYFIARRRVTPNALTQIFEQGIRIGAVLILVKKFIKKGIAYASAGVILGDCIAEGLSCLVLYLCYLSSKKSLNRLSGRKNPPFGVIKELGRISLPITSGRYLNTALRTAENVLVPKNLARYPHSGANALSQFGMIKGMALPILFFPSTLLNAISTLLIPEMSEAVAKNMRSTVKELTHQVLRLTALLSFVFGAIFLFAGQKIGVLIYKSADVGFLLVALSPIVPFMYLDSVSDGILKGLDQQTFTFRTAISDSTLRIILILCLLPISGMRGFIGIMYFSNFLTCFLNVRRLCKVSGAKLKIFREIVFPISFSLISSFVSGTLLKTLNLSSDLLFVSLFAVLSIGLYVSLLSFTKIVELKQVLQTFKR
ncbi:MAG: polysaccharide biosynthesis protein [Clostridia bacterium]|nr:polysaccharide biosynthesis protein [Clostridia bacterium]